MCNGAGACRKYAPGSVCKAGSCDGSAVDGVYVCDAAGRCKPGPATVCAPFDCDPSTNKCFSSCKTDSRLRERHQVRQRQLRAEAARRGLHEGRRLRVGLLRRRRLLQRRLPGRLRRVQPDRAARARAGPPTAASPIRAAICKNQGAASCGRTGTCDGFGGCALYPAETNLHAAGVRGQSPRHGGDVQRPRRRAARPACGVRALPVRRAARATRSARPTPTARRATRASPGAAASSRTARPARKGTECASTFCVDGVCCADACQGACRTCALPSSMGKCTPVPGGRGRPARRLRRPGRRHVRRPTASATARAAAASTPPARPAPPSTASPTSTRPRRPATATGQCVAPASLPCAPFACNGARCFGACTDRRPVRRCRTSARAELVRPRSPTARSAPTPSSAARASARRASAAPRPARPPASRARSPGAMGTCARRRPRARPIREHLRRERRPRAAARTACAPRAPARSSRRARLAGIRAAPRTRTTLHARLDVRRRGRVRDARGVLVLSLPLRRLGLQGRAAPPTPTARRPPCCTGGSCGLKAPGATCADGAECAQRLLRAGRLLPDGLHGHLPVVRARRRRRARARPCRAAAPTRRARARTRAPRAAARPGSATARAPASSSRRGTACAPPACPVNGTAQTLGRVCDGAGACKPASHAVVRALLLQRHASATRRASPTATAPRPQSATSQKNKCGDKHRLGEACAATMNASRATRASTACAARPAACGDVPGLQHRGARGHVQRGPRRRGRSARRAARPRPPCGFVGTCDGAGACRNASAATSCGTASCVELDGDARRASATAPARASRRPRAAALICATRARPASRPAAATATARRASRARTDRARTSRPTAARAPTAPSASAATASSRCAAAPRAARPARRAPSPEKPGAASPCPRAAPIRSRAASAMTASTCGTDGTCDGSGSCALFAAGHDLRARRMRRGDLHGCTAASTCNGSGHLRSPARRRAARPTPAATTRLQVGPLRGRHRLRCRRHLRPGTNTHPRPCGLASRRERRPRPHRDDARADRRAPKIR